MTDDEWRELAKDYLEGDHPGWEDTYGTHDNPDENSLDRLVDLLQKVRQDTHNQWKNALAPWLDEETVFMEAELEYPRNIIEWIVTKAARFGYLRGE